MAGLNNKSLNEHLNGIICINKPVGFTSFDVIAKMRGILRIKRLGHAGTLDPMATGVLPVFVGRATKACDILPDHDKIYEAGFKLGITTDTQDTTGKILSEAKVTGITSDKIKETLLSYTGDIMQIPPMYSAVQVNGQRLYDLARKGIEVEREARPITVYLLELVSFDENIYEGKLRISCSKGTYIRTLIHDIGSSLGVGASMTSLIRTKACGFSLENCVTFEDLQALASEDISAEKYLYPIENVFGDLSVITLDEVQEKMYRNGIKLDINRINIPDKNAERVCVYGALGNFIGTALIDKETEEFRVDKNFFV